MRVVFRLARRSFLLWFGAFFLCFGVVFCGSGLREATRESRFQETGVSVNAVVVSKAIQRASRERNTSTRYEITYQFRTDDGRTMTGVDAVGVDEWESLQPGRPFAITYLPGAPEASRARRAGGMTGPVVMVVVGAGFALVGGGIVWVTGRAVLRHRRLLRRGQPARGTVTAIRPTNVSVNRRRQWELRYRYQDHLGRTHEGASDAVPPAELEGYAVGDPVDIRFDREHGEQSIWVPPANPEAKTARRSSFWKTVRGFAVMLALLFVALVLGETVPAVRAFTAFTTRHEAGLLILTIGMTALGFILFMGAIVFRIFAGAGEGMTHADVEDMGRSMRETEPAVARVSTYRFFGRTGGSSFNEAFSVREAKDAWRRGAWRSSPRWRSNFVIMAGALTFAVGLFGIFVVIAPAGIKLLCGGALAYMAVRMIGAFLRA